MKPLVFDFFCGLFGWGESFAECGWRVVGFDIEDQFSNFGKQKPENCELVLRDIRSITGAELVATYGIPAAIVCSPPCQEFSYMAMPWSKAKEKQRKIEADPAEQKRLTDLFNQCFRIQREVSAAAGHYVPMIVENVRGAQKWVGKARWNFGSFYLWGDVPALMPITIKQPRLKALEPADVSPRVALFEAFGMTQIVMGSEGVKNQKDGGKCYGGNFGWDGTVARRTSSHSKARKKASAEIAKIPKPLAQWIARTFKPK